MGTLEEKENTLVSTQQFKRPMNAAIYTVAHSYAQCHSGPVAKC